jgi:hypothetical protein
MLEERFDGLRAVLPIDEPLPIEDLRERSRRHRRHQQVLGGAVAIGLAILLVIGVTVADIRPGRSSGLDTVGSPDASMSASLDAGYVPTGFIVVRPGERGWTAALTVGAEAGSGTTVDPSSETVPASLDALLIAPNDSDPVSSSRRLSANVSVESDYPAWYVEHWAHGSDVEHVDLSGRDVAIEGSDGILRVQFVEDGVRVWVAAQGMDRSETLRIVEGMTVDVQP